MESFKFQFKKKTQIYSSCFNGEEVLLLKPQTYMNRSGEAVESFFQDYQCQPSDLIVIYDDSDLPAMDLRLKMGGSAGGHHGLESVQNSLGSLNQKFYRIRIGIGRSSQISLADYVLSPFEEGDLEKLKLVLNKVFRCVELILSGKMNQAMNDYHRKGEN